MSSFVFHIVSLLAVSSSLADPSYVEDAQCLLQTVSEVKSHTRIRGQSSSAAGSSEEHELVSAAWLAELGNALPEKASFLATAARRIGYHTVASFDAGLWIGLLLVVILLAGGALFCLMSEDAGGYDAAKHDVSQTGRPSLRTTPHRPFRSPAHSITGSSRPSGPRLSEASIAGPRLERWSTTRSYPVQHVQDAPSDRSLASRTMPFKKDEPRHSSAYVPNWEAASRPSVPSALATAESKAAQAPRHVSIATPQPQQDVLSARLVVAQGTAVYFLPDLAHMQQAIESFPILSSAGGKSSAVNAGFGVIVNVGSDQPGIVLHAPPTPDGAGGLPIAFINTSDQDQRPLSITRCDGHGATPDSNEVFGTLTHDAAGHYVVISEERKPIMRFEGDVLGRCLNVYSVASSGQVVQVGSTQPSGLVQDTVRFEIHVGAGADAGLAILCLLAIVQIEAGRMTLQSSIASSLQLGADSEGSARGGERSARAGSLLSLSALGGRA